MGEGKATRKTRNCPFCREEISAQASVCRVCGRDVPVLLKSKPRHLTTKEMIEGLSASGVEEPPPLDKPEDSQEAESPRIFLPQYSLDVFDFGADAEDKEHVPPPEPEIRISADKLKKDPAPEQPARTNNGTPHWRSIMKMRKILAYGVISLAVVFAAGGLLFTASWTRTRVPPGQTETILLPGSVPLVMVWIPGGTYLMGRYPGEKDSSSREDSQHAVTVPGFWMGRYALTKAQWTAVMGTTPWSGQHGVLNDPNSPAVYVSWNDTKAFITALNSYTGKTFRLPSESEWEYACRAGTTTRFYWGDDPSYTQISNYAWWYGNASDVGNRYAHVVGQKLPNAFGLYDMSGNVWEWCEDDWHSNYTGAPTNGSAWVDSPRVSSRVRRGGSWGDGGYCRSAGRGSIYPSFVSSNLGLRLSR